MYVFQFYFGIRKPHFLHSLRCPVLFSYLLEKGFFIAECHIMFILCAWFLDFSFIRLETYKQKLLGKDKANVRENLFKKWANISLVYHMGVW